MRGTGRGARAAARGRPRDADRAARRDALLENALRIFLAQGYSGATIEQVAAEARVAKRTIYATVGDKTDLFVAVVRRLGDRVVRPSTAPDGDLRGFCVRLVRLMLSDEAIGLHRLVIAEAATFPDLADRLYLNGPRRYIGELERMLAERGHKADEAAAAAEQLFTLLMGERQRRRLFLLAPAPSDDEIDDHVAASLRLFTH